MMDLDTKAKKSNKEIRGFRIIKQLKGTLQVIGYNSQLKQTQVCLFKQTQWMILTLLNTATLEN